MASKFNIIKAFDLLNRILQSFQKNLTDNFEISKVQIDNLIRHSINLTTEDCTATIRWLKQIVQTTGDNRTPAILNALNEANKVSLQTGKKLAIVLSNNMFTAKVLNNKHSTINNWCLNNIDDYDPSSIYSENAFYGYNFRAKNKYNKQRYKYNRKYFKGDEKLERVKQMSNKLLNLLAPTAIKEIPSNICGFYQINDCKLGGDSCKRKHICVYCSQSHPASECKTLKNLK